MKKLIFLVSGGGGNLKFIAKYIKEISPNEFKIEAVIADRECGALQFAKKLGLTSFLISYSKESPKELQILLERLNADFIITTFHKVIEKEIVSLFKGKLINLHYSLLPSFKGLIGDKTVKEAIKLGCKFIGSTTHYVDCEVDSGKIISQCAFPIGDNPPFDNVMEAVFQSGCINLLNSLYTISGVKKSESNDDYFVLKPLGTVLFFSPILRFNTDFLNERFWHEVKCS